MLHTSHLSSGTQVNGRGMVTTRLIEWGQPADELSDPTTWPFQRLVRRGSTDEGWLKVQSNPPSNWASECYTEPLLSR